MPVKVADERLLSLQVLKLLQAVREKDFERIRKLIELGLPGLVNYNDHSSGQTALHLASVANDVDMIKLLINLNGDCNKVDKHGMTSFMKAAEYGHTQALSCLLENCDKPDLSAKDTDGKNVLYYCLVNTKRHQLCLELALRYGASVHVVAKDGKPLLVKACEEGLHEAVKTLLQSSIDVNKRVEKTSDTALHISCQHGFTKCLRLLLRYGADPNMVDINGESPAHRAASTGQLETLQILSGYGGNLNVFSKKKENPLHVAAAKGYGAVCKYLGQRGCQATVKNNDGFLPRVLAKDNEHREALRECKKAEKFKGSKPGTQLHIVKFYDWLIERKDLLLIEFRSYDEAIDDHFIGKIDLNDILIVLSSHRPPLTEKQLESILKLHDAEKNGQVDYELFFTGRKFVNKQFLTNAVKKPKSGGKRGGKKKKGKTKIDTPICTKDVHHRSKDGGPYHFYVQKQEQITDLTRFDRDHPPQHPVQDDSFWYTHQPDPRYIHLNEVIKANDQISLVSAVKDGFDVNSKDKYYKTPLMLACLEGNFTMVQYLLARGADVNHTDNFKWTALHFACHIGQRDIAELLLNNGAILDAQSFNGGTPLMRAIESSRFEIVKWLIDKGAKVQIENKQGHTALDIAKAYGDQRIILIVQNRWDQLPPPIDKRKRGSPKKKGNEKGSIASAKLSMPDIHGSGEQVEKSFTKEKNEMVKSFSEVFKLTDVSTLNDSIIYEPKRAWISQETTEELLVFRKEKRQRFGYEVDFDDYKPPFQKHVDDMMKELEAT